MSDDRQYKLALAVLVVLYVNVAVLWAWIAFEKGWL